MRVCIDARLEHGEAGGVVQGLLGLVHGLSKLDRSEDDFRLLVRPGRGEWLRPFAGDLQLLDAVRVEEPRPTDGVLEPTKGVAEAFGAEVIHLPTQQGFATPVPTIYHPWDLQHVHYPEFFEDVEREQRDRLYRALCRQARVVVAPTRWAAEDVISNLGVPRRKVAVIPGASPLSIYGENHDGDRAAEPFVLFPAQTWPHKNHLALVEALGLLARDGVPIPAVCPGWLTEFHPRIEARARELGVDMRFPGHLAGPELAPLYTQARALVFPSLFEGWGFPVLEAFSFGLPVICSNTPSLSEVVGGAAVTFDPGKPDALAGALRRVWEEAGLRRDLAQRGRARSRGFSWERTARICRAHYRKVAARPLDEEDRELVLEAAA